MASVARRTMIGFTLSEEQQMLRDLARDFARNEIAPVAEHYDRTGEFPWPIIRKVAELGLANLNIPELYGGPGASVLEECLVDEELAWGCSGIQTSLAANQLATLPILLGGSEEQKHKWLGLLAREHQIASYCVTEPGAGSDVAAIETRAERHGNDYVIKGTKTFITNASVANFYIVFAYTDKERRYHGMSCFVVERDRPGVTVSHKFDKMGQRASDTAEVVFDEVVIPAENRLGAEGTGFKLAMHVFDHSRPPVAAGAVGVAQRALDEALRYAQERTTFGRPIMQHQAVNFMLADMAMNVEAARLLTWQAAWLVDKDLPNTMQASFAKAFAADMAMKVCTDAVQIFGGYGFMKEFPVEKLMRDVKIYQIYEGTSQIQRTIIARELAGRRQKPVF